MVIKRVKNKSQLQERNNHPILMTDYLLKPENRKDKIIEFMQRKILNQDNLVKATISIDAVELAECTNF